MIYQDYIMRMIEQIVRVLAKVLFNAETGNYREAFNEIDSALKKLTGLDLNFLNRLSDKDIISLLKFSADNEISGAKCFVTGKLLKEAADLKAQEKKNDDLNTDYRKALSLYLEGILSNKNSVELFSAYFKDIEEIAAKINDDDISPDIQLKLLKFYSLTGKV